MTDEETKRLVSELEKLPGYEGWRFSYEYPGFFCYQHLDRPFTVCFTPDWNRDGELPIEVQDHDGHFLAEYSATLPLAADRSERTGQHLFYLVRPTLDKLLAIPRSLEAVVHLTEAEIAALQAARTFVREQMAHTHSWEVRDAAMDGIGKVLEAVRVASKS
jgi:hypothetical protein